MICISKTKFVFSIVACCILFFPILAMPDTLGNITIGNRTDTHNSNVIHASHFVTGATGGKVTSMSVNVGSVGAAPNNQFQVAIYSDNNNSPATLIAHSAAGALVANSWQTIAITATLTPNTAYWLAYNSNGTSSTVNNMRYSTGGTSAWSSSQASFNTWPANFGTSVKAGVTYSIYATFTPNPSNILTVSLTAPANGSTVSGHLTVTADAANATGVQFKLDGIDLGAEDNSSPYSTNWDTATVANGTHTLSAVARNSAGVTATSSASVNVNNIVNPPNPDQPILLITDPANFYTKYYEEILQAEGIKTYNSRPINQVDSTLLNNYDLVILGEMTLNDAQAALLSNWVDIGGKLIAMRPDKKLAPLLGLSAATATLPNAYLKINTSIKPGFGIVGETIQYHDTADLYALNGANAIAMLYSNATTATSSPAVTLHTVGTNGGQAAAFTYDLARSIIQTRQGNAAWAGQQRDGIWGLEANEMFIGINGQPDWNNLDKAIIPIADEQQRLFANLITEMLRPNIPVPRIWYLPRKLKAAIVMTGDNHGGAGVATYFNNFLNQNPPGCNIDNWECFRASVYLYVGTISNTQAINFVNQNFEIGLHVDTACLPWGTPAQLATLYSTQFANWKTAYPTLTLPVSTRTHCVEWDDWATQPKTKLANGMRLDTDYYYFPASFVKGRPGYFNGAGMPMRFADLDGSTIDVYQATTQVTDDSGLDIGFATSALLDKAFGPEGYYTVITTNIHPDKASAISNSDAIIAAAKARNVPIVSGRQMLQWLDARNASGIEAVSWNASVLSFAVTGGGGNGLTAMVPMDGPASVLSAISRSGATPVPYTTETVKGVPYAMFTVTPGTYFVSYTPDTNPPVIQSSNPGNGAVNVATNTNISLVANEALDVATVNSNNIELRDASGNLIAASINYNISTNIINLTPNSALQTNTTYTVLAKTGIKDLAGNALAAESQILFTTAEQATTIVIGNNQIGGLTDSHNSNKMNGSRFVNGAQRNNLSSMSVYVRNIGSAPNNKFQMAIYTDNNGVPGTLIANTTQGTLTANAWNTLPITASLQPNIAYWFVYNTNGLTTSVNNMAYRSDAVGAGYYINATVPFGTWPTIFGAGTRSRAIYSIYAQ